MVKEFDNKNNEKYISEYSQAQRIEIYKNAINNTKSYMANKHAYARIPSKGMPCPKGKVYRG